MEERNHFEILDHGLLNFVEKWGSDERIIEAARMSTDKGFRSWDAYHECNWCQLWVFNPDSVHGTEQMYCENSPDGQHEWRKAERGDFGLLSYLHNNKHATPFEMAGMTIVVQAPIMVFREWHRHRTQSFNEMSARYTPLPDVNYVPSVERLMMNSRQGKNKQAGTIKGAAELTEEAAERFRTDLLYTYQAQQTLYENALLSGVPKELARCPIGVGRYSKMMASANLRNWLAFLTLRMDAKAQWEIRQYANAVGELIKVRFPRVWQLFVEGKSL